jgi:branched-chain amino acid aminotransferase
MVEAAASEYRIWMNGRLVEHDGATTHVLSHTLHYGLGAFEGIRCYRTPKGLSIFRLEEHMQRLLDSCHLATIQCPYSLKDLCEGAKLTVRENQLDECYLRPLVWLGEGSIKISAIDNVVHTAIAAWPWGAYLGADALARGCRICVSSYRRIGNQAFLEKAKICGQYVNSVLAKREAVLNGYDEAILLDLQGYVAECTGENIFCVRDGALHTPPRGSTILAGITRDSVIKIAKELGVEVQETMFTRSDLYTSSEVFLTGTAAELTPVREIDGRRIGGGSRGPVTEKIQRAYFQLVRGELGHPEWLSYV